MEETYTIRAVEKMTGLPQQLIRTWERRYGVVQPSRTSTGRRRYSRCDVEKLTLVKAAIDAGNSIGAVARLDVAVLRRMVSAQATVLGLEQVQSTGASETVLSDCLAAVRALDAPRLAQILAYAATEMGPMRFMSEVATPLLHHLGEEWRADELHPAQEHLASEVVRAQLMRLLVAYQPLGEVPVAVVGTLRGSIHDLGALMAAVTASVAGWSVKYLGASLPAEEIIWAARAAQARAVLISIVYPPDDPNIAQELIALRRIGGNDLAMFAGGRAAGAYRRTLEDAGFVECRTLAELRDNLEAMRT